MLETPQRSQSQPSLDVVSADSPTSTPLPMPDGKPEAAGLIKNEEILAKLTYNQNLLEQKLIYQQFHLSQSQVPPPNSNPISVILVLAGSADAEANVVGAASVPRLTQ